MTDTTSFLLTPTVVRVHGPDVHSFLQSLVSQDLDPLSDGEGAPALLLQPQGKLLANMLVLRVDGDDWWCIADGDVGSALADGLRRFHIRVKATIDDLSAESGSVAVRGAHVKATVEAALLVPIGDVVGDNTAWSDARVVRVGWGDEQAVDIVGSQAAIEEAIGLLREAGIDPGTDSEYEASRIRAGVPRHGVDVDERTIPQEAFLEQSAVSFTKGCFVGQELVCRIDTRGHVNRFLRRVHLDDERAPAGAEIAIDDRVVGQLTSVAGTEALAMIRREIEPPAAVTVRWGADETSGHVAAL